MKAMSKMQTSDRILKLEVIDGEQPLSSIGLVDKRLFTGENELHAIMNDETCLWHLKYNSGGLPKALQQEFTGFSRLLQFTEAYFKRRNIKIVEVIDASTE